MVEYISIKKVLAEYYENTGETNQIREGLILKWSDDLLYDLVPPEQYEWNIYLLRVKNRTAQLPRGFRSIVQALYTPTLGPHHGKEQIEVISEIHRLWGEGGCELEIKKKCECCNTPGGCNQCGTQADPHIQVKVHHTNRLIEYPDLYFGHNKFYQGYTEFDPNKGVIRDNMQMCFYPMRTRSNNFHNVEWHVDGCMNINFDSEIEYEIRGRQIVTNVREGWILLSARTEVLDEDGYRKIPKDPPSAIRALVNYVDYNYWKMKFRNTKDPHAMNMMQLQKAEYLEEFKDAMAQMIFPDYGEMWDYLDNTWQKVHPYFNKRENLGRYQEDQFQIGY
jgi:hypothetical protein